MADEANVNKETSKTKPTKEVKAKKPKTRTLVDRIKVYMFKGVPSKKVCAEKVYTDCKTENKLLSKTGKAITVASLLQHVGNIERDIVTERKGWWSTLKVVEKDNFRQWVPKQA